MYKKFKTFGLFLLLSTNSIIVNATDVTPTNLLQEKINNSNDNLILYPKVQSLHLAGPINLNTQKNTGVILDFEGAEVILETDDAGFILGQTGSGIKNVTIRTKADFNGTAVAVIHHPVTVPGFKTLENINFFGASSSGTALRFVVKGDQEFISFVNVNNATFSRFEYALKLESLAQTGTSFINANNFSNLFFMGKNEFDVHLNTLSDGNHEVSGNNFNNLQFQYSPETQSHIFTNKMSKYNSFLNVMSWDGAGSNKLLFDIQGGNNTVVGTLPSSGNVSRFDVSTNRLMHTDSGSQTNVLQLGERVVENSRYQHKTYSFNQADLPILDVRDGDVFYDKNTEFKNRLTNIQQGKNGQTIKIIFSGNTLLSNGWGGIGQFNLSNSQSYIPVQGAVKSFTYMDGKWYEE